jgi:hypothetical protein
MLQRVVRITCACAGLAFATPCAAQNVPYVEVAGGYNFQRLQQFIPAEEQERFHINMPDGLFADVAANVNGVFGVVAVLTQNRLPSNPPVNIRTFTGGARLSARGGGRGSAFFQILAGLIGVDDSGHFAYDRAFQTGVGGNIIVFKNAGIRIEADYIRSMDRDDLGKGFNFLRFSIGATYGFGAH